MNKYVIDLQLFSNKLCDVLINKKMIDKNGKPDPIKLYNLLHPNDLITDNDIEKFGRSTFIEKTRKERNWINGANYPKTMGDVLTLCNALKCDLDYFFTDMPYTTHDIQFIHNETGLSEDAINTLKTINFRANRQLGTFASKRLSILNYILKDNEIFEDFLGFLAIYIDNNYKTPVYWDNDKHCYIDVSYKCANGEKGVTFGYLTKDNKGNDGYETATVDANLLESHAMLKMQEIMKDWKDAHKKES